MNGLRDYGTARWDGGDPACDHKRPGNSYKAAEPAEGYKVGFRTGKAYSSHELDPYTEVCGKCGARRIDAQIGLEDTPAAFVARLVEVYREVRRVLKPTGVAWMNLGDSYSGGGRTDQVTQTLRLGQVGTNVRPPSDLPGKNLLMMPARVALALQDDGWILRSEIVWAKPNPMPESVTDRPTKAHEMVYMLTKEPRYFYDADAIRENHAEATIERVKHGGRAYGHAGHQDASGMVASGGWGNTAHQHNQERILDVRGRNRRSVWTVATEPTPFAHFATFPQKLIEPMILAGCPATVCARCGKPYVRLTEPTPEYAAIKAAMLGRTHQSENALLQGKGMDYGKDKARVTKAMQTVGFAPSCACRADTRPGIVLDPFMGSGTVALVARRLGRSYIGCDLNPEYVALANERLSVPYTPPMALDAPAPQPAAAVQEALW